MTITTKTTALFILFYKLRLHSSESNIKEGQSEIVKDASLPVYYIFFAICCRQLTKVNIHGNVKNNKQKQGD